MSTHSFNIIPIDCKEVEQQLNVSFDEVVYVLSSGKYIAALDRLMMHQWEPGRWMKCKFGFIYCVKGKGII